MIRVEQVPIKMTIITDPAELAKTKAQDERFERNWKWFEAHSREIYPRYRGKHYCVSGGELFVADSTQEALALAREAHPDDDGRFTGYIPKERSYRVYAHRGPMASL